MGGADEYDGKGTIWVHDSPVGAPERDEAPPPAPVARPAAAPVAAAPMGPAPIAHAPAPAPRSGFGSTGCLVAVFALGGIGLGLVVLLGLGVVAAAWYLQAG